MNPFIKSLLRYMVRAARPHLKATGLLQLSGVNEKSAVLWTPAAQRVLVLAPHMDDETIGCGGTLALHAAHKASITVIFLTDGRNGGGGIGALSGAARLQKQVELAAIRKVEARAALKELGVEDMRCLDLCDGQLSQNVAAAAGSLRTILAQLKPQIVYLPMFVEEHPDHRAANSVLAAAIDGEQGEEFQCAGYEVWTPLFPNCIVNIDATMAAKSKALQHYHSQLQDGDYLHASIGLNAYRSIALLGGRGSYAEAFFMCRSATYFRLFDEFMKVRAG
jgi:LmbE family N-acetylglucosaminyl deacetylase